LDNKIYKTQTQIGSYHLQNPQSLIIINIEALAKLQLCKSFH